MSENYIDECVKGHSNVTVYTTNGFQIKGSIIYNCEHYVIMLSSGKKKMVYKHAISTIEPL